jgi:phytoene dehydrogenase-like protein
MKQRRPFDLVVIGAEPAGLAAAAVAARQGARVALFRAGEGIARGPSTTGVPDFVWRKLDLHESGLDAKPVSARISLFEGGRSLETYASATKTRDALERAGLPDHHLWADFTDTLEREWEEGESLTRRAAAKNGGAPALAALASPRGPDIAARLTATTRAVLDDYFADDDLKTHLASVALAPLGLGGDEPGSGLALASMSSADGWRVRSGGRGPALADVLEEAARRAGVEFIEARIVGLQPSDDKFHQLALESGETLKARHVMAASVAAAARVALPIAPALAPIARRSGAVADIRIRFAKAPPPPAGDRDAIFFIAESVETFADARDAALEGRLPERPPVSFEFARDEIVVHAPYCPASLVVDGEERDWTEQDRQAFGRMIVQRLAPYLNGVSQAARRIEVKISPAGAPQGASGTGASRLGGVVAPPPGHDAIGAAAKLALDLVSGE